MNLGGTPAFYHYSTLTHSHSRLINQVLAIAVTDDDLDGVVDEDCSSWAETSYYDSCLSNSDCETYGQRFACEDGLCVCQQSETSPPVVYDQIDGLCWSKFIS